MDAWGVRHKSPWSLWHSIPTTETAVLNFDHLDYCMSNWRNMTSFIIGCQANHHMSCDTKIIHLRLVSLSSIHPQLRMFVNHPTHQTWTSSCSSTSGDADLNCRKLHWGKPTSRSPSYKWLQLEMISSQQISISSIKAARVWQSGSLSTRPHHLVKV